MAINKIIDPNAAVQAYSRNTGIGNNQAAGNNGVSFSDFLEEEARSAIETLKGGEKMAAKAVTGEASPVDVIEAVTDAEITLEKVIALRDRLLSSYQEIMRMPI